MAEKLRIGLVDYDSKIVNLALLKLSAWHKAQGHSVKLNPASAAEIDKAYCSVVFAWNKEKAGRLTSVFPVMEFGGTGWDLQTVLPDEIEQMQPDYDLYSVDDLMPRIGGIMRRQKRREKAEVIVNAGIGFLSRGCVRKCNFCWVPKKKGEGDFHQVAEVKDLINPRSNVVIILDNNFTAAPDAVEILSEVKARGLVIDITQGIDVRTMTPEIAKALSEVKHLRSIHYAWDFISHERAVMAGVDILSRFIKKWRHLCFMLVGYNTDFQEDMYRFRKLIESGVDPYVMVYNRLNDARLRHFARWVNGRIYTSCPNFDDYLNWAKCRDTYFSDPQLSLLAA